MVGFDTKLRAYEIASNGEVIFDKENSSDNLLHFKVKQRNGNFADVYLKKRDGIDQWSCNAITTKNGKTWGCPMNVCDRSEPFCSHTLSVKMFMEKNDNSKKKFTKTVYTTA